MHESTRLRAEDQGVPENTLSPQGFQGVQQEHDGSRAACRARHTYSGTARMLNADREEGAP
jgi:hypothetical protein